MLPLRVTPVCFATQRLQIAVEWLRKGFFSAVHNTTVLPFAAESRKSYLRGCMKVASDPLAPDVSAFWR